MKRGAGSAVGFTRDYNPICSTHAEQDWAIVFKFLTLVDPGAFNGLDGGSDQSFLQLLYYSFVTLTTLGYGDISPVSPVARALAYLEAVSGVMYVAILVASLVGSFGSGPDRKSEG